VVYPVSFNGKTRFSIEMPVGSTPQQAQEVALAHESAAKWLDGKTPKKVIVVPNKIINIVL
jgi:leucyl-tRNA synthetase